MISAEDPVKRVLREGVVSGLANHTLLIARNGAECPIADSGAPMRNEMGEISTKEDARYLATKKRKSAAGIGLTTSCRPGSERSSSYSRWAGQKSA